MLKYSFVFTLEYMVNQNFVGTGSQSLKEIYINLVYQNERDIFSSYKESFPSQFSGYKDTFKNYNYDDMCAHYVKKDTECPQVGQGILTKGLRTSVVSLVESNRDIVSDFQQLNKTTYDQYLSGTYGIINSTKYRGVEEMLRYQVSAMGNLNGLFKNAMSSYMSDFQQIEKIKFSVFIVGIFLIFLLLWLPYLRSLNNKIWRTKGMLNMIPMDIITKHQNLKKAFQ